MPAEQDFTSLKKQKKIKRCNVKTLLLFVNSVQYHNIKFNFGFTYLFFPNEVPVRGRKASVFYVLLVFLGCYDYA